MHHCLYLLRIYFECKHKCGLPVSLLSTQHSYTTRNHRREATNTIDLMPAKSDESVTNTLSLLLATADRHQERNWSWWLHHRSIACSSMSVWCKHRAFVLMSFQYDSREFSAVSHTVFNIVVVIIIIIDVKYPSDWLFALCTVHKIQFSQQKEEIDERKRWRKKIVHD